MKIISKEIVNQSEPRLIKMVISAAEIAAKALPGQFVALMLDEKGERLPLTIVESDNRKGTISLIFQEAGFSTRFLGTLKPGEKLYALVGPLGHPTEIKNYGKVILVGGGVGIAEILPVARSLKKSGNDVTTILGSRNKDLLILEKELRAASDRIYVMTDDGSYGKKGFTTDMLSELLNNAKFDLVYSVGPIPMMKRVSAVSKQAGVKTFVSLNALMVDATGMCGCCRVSVSGKVKFSCIDGPDFDGAEVDWEELEKRNKVYEKQEKHICRLAFK